MNKKKWNFIFYLGSNKLGDKHVGVTATMSTKAMTLVEFKKLLEKEIAKYSNLLAIHVKTKGFYKEGVK